MNYNAGSASNNPYAKGIDWVTVLIYLVLVAFGWFNLYAANFNPETKVFFSTQEEYFKQLMWMGVTVIMAGIVFLMDSRIFVEFAKIIYWFSIGLLLLTLVVGKEVNGAKAWLGAGAVQFQPVELTKLGATLVCARIMSRYNFKFNFRSYLHLAMVLLIPIAFVLLQNDTGSALIFMVLLLPMFREGLTPHVLLLGGVSIIAAIAALLCGSQWVMVAFWLVAMALLVFYIVGLGYNRIVYVALALSAIGALAVVVPFAVLGYEQNFEYIAMSALVLPTVYLLWQVYLKRMQWVPQVLMYAWMGLVVAFATGYLFNNVLIEHQRTRINILFGIEDDPLGAGYNVNQSLIAIGSGGFLGKGFLQGTQTKLNFVPKQTTDFIFCTVGEEWGFLGCVGLIVLYLCFFYRIISLAEKQHSVFSRVYGYSIASIFFFHFTVNICMTIGLMPVIGIPLPFFSYGGSSFLGFSMMLFVFLKLDTSRNELIR